MPDFFKIPETTESNTAIAPPVPVRVKLPNRRHLETQKIECGGLSAYVTLGFHPKTGKLSEVFVRKTGAVGNDMGAILNDASIILSHFLQTGGDVVALAKSMGRLDGYAQDLNAPPASAIGAVVDFLAGEVG